MKEYSIVNKTRPIAHINLLLRQENSNQLPKQRQMHIYKEISIRKKIDLGSRQAKTSRIMTKNSKFLMLLTFQK